MRTRTITGRTITQSYVPIHDNRGNCLGSFSGTIQIDRDMGPMTLVSGTISDCIDIDIRLLRADFTADGKKLFCIISE